MSAPEQHPPHSVSRPYLDNALAEGIVLPPQRQPITGYHNPDAAAAAGGPARLKWVVEGVKLLYMCKPADALLRDLYAPGGIFTDPLGQDVDPFLAFKGLAELVEPVPDPQARFELVEAAPQRLVLEMHLRYKLRGTPVVVPFSATTVLKLTGGGAGDGGARGSSSGGVSAAGSAAGAGGGSSAGSGEGKAQILQHEDLWGGYANWRSEDHGLLGKVAELRRKVTGAAQEAFVKATGGDKRQY